MTKIAKNSKKCILSGCAQVINNLTELLAREKQWRQAYLPISNSYEIRQYILGTAPCSASVLNGCS